MRNLLVISALMLLLVLCGGCGRQQPFGNFAKAESADLVRDALSIMLFAYPPAKTRLALLQGTEDMFGLRLVESLRGNGYAVAEFVPPTKRGKGASQSEGAAGVGFAYILDYLKDGGELRLTLYVGGETLSRMYLFQDDGATGRYVPAGSWLRRQEGERHAGQ